MKDYIIETPKMSAPYQSPFSYSEHDIERMNRKRERAAELGIRLFVLDGEESQDELNELEHYIIDNYIDMDKDVPDELKQKYLSLKNKIERTRI